MTYRLPSLNSLRAFEAAARHLSFRAAANEIGVTSGAISQQVRKLERSLGVDLFQRLQHGLLLTKEGNTYLPKITKIFDALTAATEEIAPDVNGKKFAVGVCPRAAAILPDGWPFGGQSLESYVRERILTSDVEHVRNGAIDCLVRLDDKPCDPLEVFEIAQNISPSGQDRRLQFICKAGLAKCRQTEELISNLHSLWPTKT